MWRTRWESEKNFLGAYSFASMAALANGGTISSLRERLYDDGYKPRILFAGEATHEPQSSFAHGAVLSGYREAEYLSTRLL
jgi:monoamine oxidase